MPAWTRREVTVRRIDHVLRVPAVGVELYKAMSEAERHYRRTHAGTTDGELLPDDIFTITVTDDEVVISYTIEEAMR